MTTILGGVERRGDLVLDSQVLIGRNGQLLANSGRPVCRLRGQCVVRVPGIAVLVPSRSKHATVVLRQPVAVAVDASLREVGASARISLPIEENSPRCNGCLDELPVEELMLMTA